MASKKTKEELEKGPTMTGVLVLGVGSALIGALLCFLFLSSLPVKSLASKRELEGLNTERLKREVRPNDVYYFDAPSLSGDAWASKRSALLSGESSEVNIRFGDLNAWTARTFRPSNPPAGGEKGSIVLSMQVPKFGTDGEGTVYISLPLSMEVLGKPRKYLVHARGHFNSQNTFAVDSLYVNNAPVPAIPGFSDFIFYKFLELFSESEDYQAIMKVWPKVESVEVTENSLLIQL